MAAVGMTKSRPGRFFKSDFKFGITATGCQAGSSRHLFPSETLLRPATDSIHTGPSLQKRRRCAHRAEELDARTKNCPLTLSERAPVVGGCREKNQGERFWVDTGHGRFGGGGCGFSFIPRIVTRSSGI